MSARSGRKALHSVESDQLETQRVCNLGAQRISWKIQAHKGGYFENFVGVDADIVP
jgi:hypothetical protein